MHAWEEPPVSAQAGSGAVFFSNCSLRCVYCQNAEIAHGGFGREISTERLVQIFFELQDQHAANLNLVTATHYLPWVLLALDAARATGLRIPVLWNSSGYECVETIEALEGRVDAYLTDFKYFKSSESDAALRYSGAADYFDVAVPALDAMVDQVGSPVFDDEGILRRGVIVRHLLLPGRLEDSKRIMAFLIKRYGDAVLFSVMNQYTPVRSFPQHPELEQRTDLRDYASLLDYMDSIGFEDYFWQEGDPAQQSFIPLFDATGV